MSPVSSLARSFSIRRSRSRASLRARFGEWVTTSLRSPSATHWKLPIDRAHSSRPPRAVAVRIEDPALLRRRARLQARAENVRRAPRLKRRLVVPADHPRVGHHREPHPGMVALQRLERRHEGVALVGAARKQLVADRQPLRRHQKREHDLHPVRLAVLAVALEPQAVLPVALEIQACRVVEDRRQRLRQQGLRDLQRPAADRLDPPVVEHVHAAVDVVQVQRQLAMGVEFANRGALGQRPGDPRQHQLLDDAVGARPARAEQAVPAEKVVDGAEGLPDPDDDPALLAAVGQVGAERRGIADRAPGLLEKIDEFLRREQGGPGAVRIAHLLDDEAGEAFELLELGRAGRRADMAQDALADLAAAAHGLDDLDLDAVSGELLPSHEHGGMMAAGGQMSIENTTEGTTTPISPAGAKRINYTRLAEVESPVKGLNSRKVILARASRNRESDWLRLRPSGSRGGSARWRAGRSPGGGDRRSGKPCQH